MYILTASQMKAAEEKAAQSGMTYERMMENAGVCAARIIDKKLKEKGISPEGTRVSIVCGKSNNGGDGFVIARKLSESDYTVKVILALGEPVSAEAQNMFRKLSDTSVQISNFDYNSSISNFYVSSADVLVDCVFGTGFKGEADVRLGMLFDTMNACKGTKFAVDIPSGLWSDKGETGKKYFKADFTLAIQVLKYAHVLKPAAEVCGDTVIVKIGIPDMCFEREYPQFTLCDDEIKKKFPQRPSVSNKGDYGRVLCVCGSKNYQGAAYLSAMGAVRSGAGLVFAAFPDCAYSAIAAKLTDTPLLPMPSNSLGMFSISALPELIEQTKKADVMVLGSGLGISADTKEIVEQLILDSECPIILDADGINLICDNIDILKQARSKITVTPHPGEMSRLTGMSVDEIQNNRAMTAKGFADYFGVTTLLKGANSIVAYPGRESLYVNSTGNTGLSKGGSGDVLGGIIAGFTAQGFEDPEICAVYIHGLNAERTTAKLSQRGAIQSDFLNELALLLSDYEK